jgi:hypothetical protein
MGIAQTTVKAWELDAERPDERQMEQLMKLLGFDPHAVVGDCLPPPHAMPEVIPPSSGAFPAGILELRP